MEHSHKNPKLQVILIKYYKIGDSEKLPLRNKVPHNIPPVEPSGTKEMSRFVKERNLRAKKVREYLVRYSDKALEDEWLAENTYLKLPSFSEDSDTIEIPRP
ncbi:hypothetical protein O181_004461 [Austropuccinia psidii MF-1]|uniref:Uncharacterized protein n=1 Tax=Austropuccinia psidii MF-1 TaxID=1389203 RepID=A0A9Q3BFL3_9BASI|nr:hypothetical protein [Austropuccinia psidii MF-1]